MTGCAMLKKPFATSSHAKYTGKGERIPVIVYEQGMKPASALKGAGFYLPAPSPISAGAGSSVKP